MQPDDSKQRSSRAKRIAAWFNERSKNNEDVSEFTRFLSFLSISDPTDSTQLASVPPEALARLDLFVAGYSYKLDPNETDRIYIDLHPVELSNFATTYNSPLRSIEAIVGRKLDYADALTISLIPNSPSHTMSLQHVYNSLRTVNPELAAELVSYTQNKPLGSILDEET